MSTSFKDLPKALLHEHLDGGLRPATLLDLCRAQQLPTPVDDAPQLGDWMLANAHSGSLERYLRGFSLTVAAMASAAAWPKPMPMIGLAPRSAMRRKACSRWVSLAISNSR